MKLIVPAVLCLGLLTLAGGCVSQQHADNQHDTIRAYKERVTELESKIDELNQRISLLQGSGDATSAEVLTLTEQRDMLQAQVDQLTADNTKLRTDLARALNAAGQLPEEVENELKAFARNYPNLAQFDPVTGAVKFASDVTFGLGSDKLSDPAAKAMVKLAEVFNSDSAKTYEVRIVGHTDTVPISRPSTRAKHPSNWHLSVHRAISVRGALEKAGVDKLRLSVAGYGPYRPVAQNTRRGAEPNRRVEIYLVPMVPVDSNLLAPTGTSGGSSAASAASSSSSSTTNTTPAAGAYYK